MLVINNDVTFKAQSQKCPLESNITNPGSKQQKQKAWDRLPSPKSNKSFIV